jgi:hypothetical protein
VAARAARDGVAGDLRSPRAHGRGRCLRRRALPRHLLRTPRHDGALQARRCSDSASAAPTATGDKRGAARKKVSRNQFP